MGCEQAHHSVRRFHIVAQQVYGSTANRNIINRGAADFVLG